MLRTLVLACVCVPGLDFLLRFKVDGTLALPIIIGGYWVYFPVKPYLTVL